MNNNTLLEKKHSDGSSLKEKRLSSFKMGLQLYALNILNITKVVTQRTRNKKILF
jgi:chemotaxis signal transduction protein